MSERKGVNCELTVMEQLAAKVTDTIWDCCERIMIAGSIRRRRPTVNDIDIVVIPRSFMWNVIAINLKKEMDAKIEAMGSELMRTKIPVAFAPDGFIQVDIYCASGKTWGICLLVRTGSKEHNVKLAIEAKRKGLAFSVARGILEDGQVIASCTEEEIFKALELEYVTPADRECPMP